MFVNTAGNKGSGNFNSYFSVRINGNSNYGGGFANVKTGNPGANGGGVYFGDGTKEPTIDDYTLSGNGITNISASVAVKDVEEGVMKATYLITNNGESAVTISEVAMFCCYNYEYSCNAMIDRTLLDSPVTIEPGGIGEVTYVMKIPSSASSA